MRTASMDVRAVASLRLFARVGFVIPRYKHSAVDRNRLKRRLRELVRLELLPTLRPMDMVLRVAPVAYTRTFELLRAELLLAARQLEKVVLPTAVVTEREGRSVSSAGEPEIAKPLTLPTDTASPSAP